MQMTRLRRSLALVASAALLASLAAATVAAPASAAEVDPAAKKTVKCDGKVATKVGTPGNDKIRGTAKRDIIAGLGGNDVILGGGGDDIICGGSGNDRLTGNAGKDKLIGGGGRDRLFGGDGPDRLFGGPANDFLAGQAGPDVLGGGPNADKLDGGTGVDLCSQGTGNGPMVRCELPKSVFAPPPTAPTPPPPPPAPTPGTLVIGGPASGQVGGTYESYDGGPWNLLSENVTPDRCSTDNYEDTFETNLRRMAMEFPLSGLPAGSSVTKATLDVFHVDTYGSTVDHSLRGYPGNGTIEEADILVGGTAKTFTPSVPGTTTTVVVTDLVTPTVVASGWAGLAMQRDVNDVNFDYWHCKPDDATHPTLTIDYLAP